ncbi:MAG TPA: hypothetical protein VGC42_17275 [Kofleriaceae bacterium]
MIRRAVGFTMMVALAACGGPASHVQPGAPAPVAASTGEPRCDAVRGKIEQLYRAEAQAREPKRVDEAVADNTAMVLASCRQAPATLPDCVRRVSTSQQLEATCLPPLDDEGSEGDPRAH